MSDKAGEDAPASVSKGAKPAASEPPRIAFAEFLETVSPLQFRVVTDLCEAQYSPHGGVWHRLTTPQLKLHCTNEACNGPRFFRFTDGDRTISVGKDTILTYFTYICSNCRIPQKIFSIYVSIKGEKEHSTAGLCYKFGEYPVYGPPTPTRLLRLFGKDREIFLKGRQCENHGLGIGAFGYYRRVVENHKNDILDEIIKVAQKIAPEMVKTLDAAKNENQFSKGARVGERCHAPGSPH
jgi:hypothetical protein